MRSRIPWRKLREPDRDHVYVVSVGVFVVDRARNVPAFVRHAARVRRVVHRTPGLVGYALMADLGLRTFTEMAAFESVHAMRRFAAGPVHAAAIRAMLPHIGAGSKIVSIELFGRDLPPGRDVAMAALEAAPGVEDGQTEAGEEADVA
jgi:hypothetical protein